jgi:hypothetical protein
MPVEIGFRHPKLRIMHQNIHDLLHFYLMGEVRVIGVCMGEFPGTHLFSDITQWTGCSRQEPAAHFARMNYWLGNHLTCKPMDK